jgi:hypothetical protein
MIQSLKQGLNKELFGYRCIILDVDSGKVGMFSSKCCIICREGRKNIEKHGKRFVTLAGANLTWSTSA